MAGEGGWTLKEAEIETTLPFWPRMGWRVATGRRVSKVRANATPLSENDRQSFQTTISDRTRLPRGMRSEHGRPKRINRESAQFSIS